MAKINQKYVEILFVLIVFTLFLWYGSGNINHHKLNHDFPTGHYASDNFWNLIYAENTYETGQYKYRPFYTGLGEENIYQILPPLIYVAPASISYVSNINPFDTQILLVTILFSLIPIIGYLIIRRFNKKVAIIALSFTAFLLSGPNYAVVTWGKYGTIFGLFFLLLAIFLIQFIRLDYMYIIIGLVIAALFHYHAPEFLFSVIIFTFYCLYQLISTKDMSYLKKLIYTGVVALLATIYFMIIFKSSWLSYPMGGAISSLSSVSYPIPFIKNYSYLIILVLMGLVLSIFKLFSKNKKEDAYVIIAFMIMLSFSFLNVIFGERSFQQRYAWPIYFGLFFGLGIYFILQYIKPAKNIVVITIVSLIIFILIVNWQGSNIQGTGLMDSKHWEGFEWIRENTAKDSKILFIYGDSYGQNAQLPLTKRETSLVLAKDYIPTVEERKIKKEYLIRNLANDHGLMIYNKGLLKYEFYLNNENQWKKTDNQSLCNFDYLITDKVSRAPALSTYSLIVASDLIKNEWITPIFENDVMVIMKNDQPGVECIEERTI